MPELKYKVKLSREEAFPTDRVIAQFERKVTSVVGSSMTASLHTMRPHVEACSGAHVGWNGLFFSHSAWIYPGGIHAATGPYSGLGKVSTSWQTSSIQLIPALCWSLLHLGSFRTLPERDCSRGQSGRGKKKRLVLLKHKRNFILPAPHLGCVSVYNGDQGWK